MARRLKGFRKIDIDGEIWYWKVKTTYYDKTVLLYSPDEKLKEIGSDDYYR